MPNQPLIDLADESMLHNDNYLAQERKYHLLLKINSKHYLMTIHREMKYSLTIRPVNQTNNKGITNLPL